MTTIALFGDSILGQLTKPRLAALERAVPGETLVANCAVGGWDSADGLRAAGLVARLGADIVVLSFGMNDCAPWKQVPLDDFARNVDRIVEIFSATTSASTSASTVLALLPPSIAERGEPQVSARDNATLQAYGDRLRQAVRPGFAIDADLALAEVKGRDVEVHKDDGIHLNDAGYEPIIAALADRISRSFALTEAIL